MPNKYIDVRINEERCITFHKYMTPFGPAEDIEELVEFDPDALSTALAQ